MTHLKYHPGEKNVARFSIPFNKGRANLTCTITERWDELFAVTVSCGKQLKRTVEKTVGISASESRELESTIKSSLGGQAILSLQSEIRRKLNHEIRLEESLKETHDLEFDSPACGVSTHRVYQLQRTYSLDYQDNSFWFWRKRGFKRAITEWVDNFIMPPALVAQRDPACNCDPEPAAKPSGMVAIVFNNFVVYTDYHADEQGIVFPRLNSRFPVTDIGDLFGANISVERRLIPAYVTTISGVSSETLNGRVRPYQKEFETPVVDEGVAGRNINFADVLVAGTGLAAVAWLFLTGKHKQQETVRVASIGAGKGAPSHVKITSHSIINRPPEELYHYWRDFENLPAFMGHLERVMVAGETRSHWVAKAPPGRWLEWDVEITEDRPSELISWRSIEGAGFHTSGSVYFTPATGSRGTVVKLVTEYELPATVTAADKKILFGEESQELRQALRSFKQLMEVGEVVTAKSGRADSDADAAGTSESASAAS